MKRDIGFFLLGVAWVVVVILVSFATHYKSHCRRAVEQERWRTDVQAKTITGEQVEIRVYNVPLADGGYVINVKRESDPPGECWGTVIYPVR